MLKSEKAGATETTASLQPLLSQLRRPPEAGFHTPPKDLGQAEHVSPQKGRTQRCSLAQATELEDAALRLSGRYAKICCEQRKSHMEALSQAGVTFGQAAWKWLNDLKSLRWSNMFEVTWPFVAEKRHNRSLASAAKAYEELGRHGSCLTCHLTRMLRSSMPMFVKPGAGSEETSPYTILGRDGEVFPLARSPQPQLSGRWAIDPGWVLLAWTSSAWWILRLQLHNTISRKKGGLGFSNRWGSRRCFSAFESFC